MSIHLLPLSANYRIGLDRYFKLPAEHGAVVCFSLSGLLALALSAAPAVTGLSLVFLWLLLGALDSGRLKYALLALAVTSAFILQQPLLVLTYVAMASGRSLFVSLHKIGLDLKQLMALSGIALLPLSASVVAPAGLSGFCCAGALFLHATMLAVSVVFYFLANKNFRYWIPAVLCVSLVLAAGLFAPFLASSVFALGVVQICLLLHLKTRPSMKCLGIIETVYLSLIVAIVSVGRLSHY